MLVFCDGCVNHGFHFGCNSGLILSGGRLFCYGKDGLFFKQATELNKNQVPAKALWVQCIWVCALYFGKVRY
jgi:APA family basic amino acid/polyamine antiporter